MDKEIINRDKIMNELMSHKYGHPLSFADFCSALKFQTESILLKRGIMSGFIIDEVNKPYIYQLYLYLTANEKCVWDLHSGLIFAGKIGVGKTLLLTAFIQLSNELVSKQIEIYHSFELIDKIMTKEGRYHLRQRPIFVDEFGKEPAEVNDFGTIRKPLVELFATRYEKGGRFFATTNFTLSALERIYGDFIISRLKESCNYIVLKGESRRLNHLHL